MQYLRPTGIYKLTKHKFGHNFGDSLNSLFSCALEIESKDLFLRYQIYVVIQELSSANSEMVSLKLTHLVEVIFYSDKKLIIHKSHHRILTTTIK